MKILNLYAGIGGNRKLWGDTHEITAIEYKQEIADIYHDFFPKDKIIVADAHQYLLDHFQEFDFIWSSPPCPTHSRLQIPAVAQNTSIRYPDMALYQEIIFLKYFFKGKWCIENVISYYDPLIRPSKIADHYFWSNFVIRDFIGEGRGMGKEESLEKHYQKIGFNLSKYKNIDKMKIIRNCVEPEVGKHILDNLLKPPMNKLF